MRRPIALVLITTAIVVGCIKEDNPLVAATDGQFARVVEPKNAFSPSCAAALYEPEAFVTQYNSLKFSSDARIQAVSEQQRAECTAELQKRAGDIGIAGNVNAAHLADERVKQRYLEARKK